MSETTAAAATVSIKPSHHAPRKRFHVQLDPSNPVEVSLKELQLQQQQSTGTADSTPPSTTPDDQPPTASPPVEASSGSEQNSSAKVVPELEPRYSRYNIIERLEKRYGGGVVASSTDNGAAQVDGMFHRTEDDDLYDSEDSFIDDEELHQNIEELHGETQVQTKHSGFFVNAGDEIETFQNKKDDSESGNKLGKVGESSRAVKNFLDEWSDAAAEWQPSQEVLDRLQELREAALELTKTSPFTKVFPRSLDDTLRAVDKVVVDSHPNRWRVNGYFATLMTFLPFTKQYLKTNMLRLEARDNARSVKDEVEKLITAFADDLPTYISQAQSTEPNGIKEELAQNKELGQKLHAILTLHDEWVVKENEFRPLLKNEDKKNMPEQEYAQLNARQERNRILSRLVTLFPQGHMDVSALRRLHKLVKPKQTKKKTPTAPSTQKPKTTVTPPTKKSTVSSTSQSPSSVKRPIRAFKSRAMDESPAFNENDFE